ncbi:MAG: hypothetical protein E7170_00015 [Firmicutes bacterium]|nr:hypothetical protein [Bacillota bacterium]
MKNSTFYKVLKHILKKTKLRTLIMFIILLSFNSTAWFIYATKVENGISAKVVAWNVSFVTGENELLEYINFDIDNIYPGMETYTEKIEVKNNGETNANLNYEIKNVRILDYYYEVNKTVTSDALLSSIANDYPFKIRVGVSGDEIKPGEKAYFYVTVSWDYESGDDEADTYWGNKSYYFHENNDKSSVELNLVISAVQKKE